MLPASLGDVLTSKIYADDLQLLFLDYSKCQRCGISGTLNKSIFYRDRLRNAHEASIGASLEEFAGDVRAILEIKCK